MFAGLCDKRHLAAGAAERDPSSVAILAPCPASSDLTAAGTLQDGHESLLDGSEELLRDRQTGTDGAADTRPKEQPRLCMRFSSSLTGL
ncbi:hypothetical protein UY3_09578 [Chelonia mydas]|uniref:Uncharacterized protein n=1 Tax=Chelonia mydas TaxID=8469 RepID=M7BMK5_CHEMY|nr:hypothetical protein UY3_09578 [Chelonia mydas]